MSYRKTAPRFWKDEKVRQLDSLDKMVALYIFTGQSNRIGIFTFSIGMAAEDTGLSVETFAQRCRNVCLTLKWGWDEQAGVMYLPTWWKYDDPPNPNNIIGCLTDLNEVPDSPLVAEFCANVSYLTKPNFRRTFTQTLSERYPKRLGTPLPLPLPLPETKTLPLGVLSPSNSNGHSRVPLRGNTARRGFDTFWAAYPRHRGKEEARKAWNVGKTPTGLEIPGFDVLLPAIARAKTSPEWADPKFIPFPATWLRQGRWLDESTPEVAAPDPYAKFPR